jgi:chorismate mutase
MDLEMRGLMVETHINPAVALSDAAQQLTPEALIAMIQRLELRSLHAKAAPAEKQLVMLRKQIDKADEKLLKLLAERKNIIEKIGEFKRDNNLTVLQLNRWDEVLKNRLKLAEELNLNPVFIEKFLVAMHEESIAIQVKILNTASEHA